MFWPITVLLFLLAILFVLVPLWRRRKVETFESRELRKAANIALFHERNNELEADLAAGEIDREQFDTLITELQQNLLSDVSDEEREAIARERFEAGKSDIAAGASQHFGLSFALPVLLALLVPFVAYLLYQHWGFHDDVQLRDYFERTVNNQGDPEEARELVVALGEAVQENEDQPWAWYFLGENFANIGMFTEAQIAYQRAARLLEDIPEKALVLGRVALAMYVNNELELTPEVQAVIDQARAINPNEISVLQLLAADAEQRQDYQEAIEYWRLMIQANPNSSQADALRENIAAAREMLGEDGEAIADGPVVEVHLALADNLQLDDNLRVFVAARNAEREGMPPLAAVEFTVADLPTSVTLDNNSAVGPFNLSTAETVYVSALVSRAGVANPQSGDYRVQSEAFSIADGEAEIDLVIQDRVP